MTLNSRQVLQERHANSGFALITVLFMLLLLGGLAVLVAQISATQHAGVYLAQAGRQAYYAAQTGAHWGVRRLLTSQGCEDEFDYQSFRVKVYCEDKEDGVTVMSVAQARDDSVQPFGPVARKFEIMLVCKDEHDANAHKDNDDKGCDNLSHIFREDI
jgi:type II secretory pathway component PulK